MTEHQHSFAVDAACDCGLMISDIMRGLQAEVVALREQVAQLESDYEAECKDKAKLLTELAELRQQLEYYKKLAVDLDDADDTRLAARIEGLREVKPYHARFLRGDKKDTCIYLTNGEKVVLKRDGKRVWLEIVSQDTIHAAENRRP